MKTKVHFFWFGKKNNECSHLTVASPLNSHKEQIGRRRLRGQAEGAVAHLLLFGGGGGGGGVGACIVHLGFISPFG